MVKDGVAAAWCHLQALTFDLQTCERGVAGAVLMVTAEGKCIIKVFPPEEDAEGPEATDGQTSCAQVLRLPRGSMLSFLPPALLR